MGYFDRNGGPLGRFRRYGYVIVILFLFCLGQKAGAEEREWIFIEEKVQTDQEVPLPEKIRQAQDEFREWQDSQCHWEFEAVAFEGTREWQETNPGWEPMNSVFIPWEAQTYDYSTGHVYQRFRPTGIEGYLWIIFKKRVCP